MAEMPSLNVQSPAIESRAAEEYIKNNVNSEWPLPETFFVFNEMLNEMNKYRYEDAHECTIKHYSLPSKQSLGRLLSDLIKSKEDLFCQLEHKLRGTPIEDVKNSLTLMKLHLECSNVAWNSGYSGVLVILMNDKSVLHTLGCVAAAIYVENVQVEIVVGSKIVAPLCHLFITLCSQIGWRIPLVYANNTETYISKCGPSNLAAIIKDLDEQRCTAVVTEKADIDSALDSIVYSSSVAPWRLSRVFVQESVYDDFKSGLAWKSKRLNLDHCADAFEARGKTFLCDQFRKSADSGVTVEAYRTVKELLGLIKRHNTLFLSVWAENSELSNEIALNAPSHYTWINEYAVFHGPPQTCLPVYEKLYVEPSKKVAVELIRRIRRNYLSWHTTRKVRKERILQVILDFDITGEVENAMTDAPHSFVRAEDGVLCFGIERAAGEGEALCVNVENRKDIIKVLRYIANGYIVVYELSESKQVPESSLLRELSEKITAIMCVNDNRYVQSVSQSEIVAVPLFDRLKVFCTRFGTVFAN